MYTHTPAQAPRSHHWPIVLVYRLRLAHAGRNGMWDDCMGPMSLVHANIVRVRLIHTSIPLLQMLSQRLEHGHPPCTSWDAHDMLILSYIQHTGTHPFFHVRLLQQSMPLGNFSMLMQSCSSCLLLRPALPQQRPQAGHAPALNQLQAGTSPCRHVRHT